MQENILQKFTGSLFDARVSVKDGKTAILEYDTFSEKDYSLPERAFFTIRKGSYKYRPETITTGNKSH